MAIDNDRQESPLDAVPRSRIDADDPIVGRARVSNLAIVLGLASVIGAIGLAFAFYRHAIDSAIEKYQYLYLNKAKSLSAAVTYHTADNGKVLLEVIDTSWRVWGNVPADEYVLVVDADANVIFQATAPFIVAPDITGQPVANHIIFGDSSDRAHTLHDLIKLMQDHVGGYIAHDNAEHVGAFVWVPHRHWLLGVLRTSHSAS